ncbi:MAG: universal stress protein [Deinococcus sp.]|nr:universal stress protein [Deinococcus sp.]
MSNSAGGFRRIAVGIDFSPSSLHALEVARTRFPGAELRLLHALDVRMTAAPDVMGGLAPVGYDPALLDTLEQGDAQQLAGLAQPGESQEQLVGDPVSSLLDAAQAWHADLLVVGTHARAPLEHFFLGSTAEKLVARSPVPVLTVRLPRRGAAGHGPAEPHHAEAPSGDTL